jgi:hypothetical protein
MRRLSTRASAVLPEHRIRSPRVASEYHVYYKRTASSDGAYEKLFLQSRIFNFRNFLAETRFAKAETGSILLIQVKGGPRREYY